MAFAVAIDGPSGAGKSTIARTVASELHLIYVDTGAMYRAIGHYMLSNHVDIQDDGAVTAALPSLTIAIRYVGDEQRVFANAEDVSDLIRTPAVSMAASRVSAIPAVRSFLLQVQRDLAEKNSVIMDGRDIGTVILPHANVKIYLTASAEARAKRRFAELQEKGDPSTYEQVLADMEKRDHDDTHRAIAPLRQAPDAILIDTSHIGLEESIAWVRRTIEERME